MRWEQVWDLYETICKFFFSFFDEQKKNSIGCMCVWAGSTSKKRKIELSLPLFPLCLCALFISFLHFSILFILAANQCFSIEAYTRRLIDWWMDVNGEGINRIRNFKWGNSRNCFINILSVPKMKKSFWCSWERVEWENLSCP